MKKSDAYLGSCRRSYYGNIIAKLVNGIATGY